ncbi:MAG: HD domain-containing phosphohydrolase [Isosphaeraceae bacterium]|nr:HD domain-containing phosphohydrolase [Isosphaeraceae bacterium]
MPHGNETMGRADRSTILEDEAEAVDGDGALLFHAAHTLPHTPQRRATPAVAGLLRSLRRLETLRKIDRAISDAIDPREALDILLEQVTEQLDIDAASVLLLDRESRVLRFVRSRGFRSNALEHTRLELGEGWAGEAACGCRVIHVEDLASEPGGFVRSPYFAHEDFVSYWAVPLQARGDVIGVIEVFTRSHLEVDEEWTSFLLTISTQAAIAVDHEILLENLRRSNLELSQAYDETIEGWARALEFRDHETEGHCRRVVDMTVRLARAFGITEPELTHIRRGALLHDIGKMGVPDAILLKPGKLDDDEWTVMRKHTQFAYDLLRPIRFLAKSIDIPYCHHEKWDGSGYPRGLKGEEIPFAARLFAAVDIWDALGHDRPYRKAWPRTQVIEHLKSLSGTHLDPSIIPVFIDLLERNETHREAATSASAAG